MPYYRPPSQMMGDWGRIKRSRFVANRAGLGGPAGRSYLQPWMLQRGMYRGDPFLGFAAPLLGGLVKKFGGKAAAWLGKAAKRTIGGAVSKATRRIGGHPLAGAVIGGAATGAVIGGMSGRGGGGGAAGGFRRGRMNVGNVKALRRSMRRVEGFATLARKTISFTKAVRMKSSRKGKR
ncbi:MAG TPA: hypothetical protein VK573_12435 [Gemmatimonadales bacterium]|nr:hypothetical protein [Gemmatimonadales bacterium]